MFYKFCCLFFMFIVCSFIGYIIEVLTVSNINKKITFNRGFLMGPYIPLYGVGAVGCYLLLRPYQNDILALFCISAILSSILEYFTSYILEKIFGVRWWDYSNEKFNLEGRICLKNSIIFGLVGIIVISYLYPLIYGYILLIPKIILEIISIILLIIFIIDLSFTIRTLFGIKDKLDSLDETDITETAHFEMMREVKKHNFRINRILQAFPDNEGVNIKEFRELKELVEEYRKKSKNRKKKKK